jgi:NAD(P)H-dependent flavin oxidoreductase YrpB (nitropropane dioxygenase family)
MPTARKSICMLALLAVLVVPTLSGCGNSEPTLAVAVAKSGVLGSLTDGLKREDDEAEVKELRESAPHTSEERREAREAQEQATIEAAPEPEGES